MEVEFGWVGGGVGWGGVQTHFHVKPNSVEVVLRLIWGCDNLKITLMTSLKKPSRTTSTRVKHFVDFIDKIDINNMINVIKNNNDSENNPHRP